MSGLSLKHLVTSTTLLTQVRSIHGIKHKYFIHNKNIFSATMAIRLFLTRHARLSDGVTQPTSFLRSNGLLQKLIQRRKMSQLDVNMNVQNNVLLYKNERHAYFRNVKLIAVGQIFGWSILSFYTYKSSFWDIFNTDIKFKEYWFNHMLRLPTFLFSIFVGPSMFLTIYALCSRNVKYLILNKGGKTISIVTHHMRKKKSSLNVPVEMVNCITDRKGLGAAVTLKLKNKSFYYLLDRQGTFINPKLFDHATG